MHVLEHYSRFRVPFGCREDVVACDSFGRANSTDLGSTDQLPHRPGRPGFAWTEEAGDWEINTNRIGSVGTSPDGLGWLAKCDPGIANMYIEVQFAYTLDGNNNRIRFRVQDANNWVCLTHTSSAMTFGDCVAGVVTNRGTGTTGVTPASGDLVVISAIGSALTARIIRAGVQVGTAATATISNFSTATGVGFRAATAAVRWRNLVVRRAA
jgi:hypothetical protein